MGQDLHIQLRLEPQNAGESYILDEEFSGGCLCAIVGPRKSGKSRILKFVAGLIRSCEGVIHYGDEVWFDSDSRQFTPASARSVLYLSLDSEVPDLASQTVKEYFEGEIRALQKIPFAEKVRIWETCNLDMMSDKLVQSVPLYWKQVLLLACAVARKPDWLLVDQSFDCLQIDVQMRIQRLLQKIRKELEQSILLATQEHLEIYSHADRVIFLPCDCIAAALH